MNGMITIIVPIYNAEKYLENCLISLVNQTYSNLQIILIDDNSSDNSSVICKKYISKYSNIIYLFNEANRGVSFSRNVGLKHCKGDYVTFVDADDILDVNFVKEAMDIFYGDNSIDSVFFEYKKISKNCIDFRSEKLSIYGKVTASEAYRICLEESYRFVWGKVYKTRFINKIQFDINIYRGEDTLFLCEVLAKMKNIFLSEKKYYNYIQSENSATRTSFNMKKITVLEAFEKIIYVTNKYFPELLEISKKEYCLEARMLLRELAINQTIHSQIVKDVINEFKKVYASVNDKGIFTVKHRLILYLISVSPSLYFFINKKIKSI